MPSAASVAAAELIEAPAGGVPHRLVADRHQGPARGGVRRPAGAGGRRAGRRRRAAPARARRRGWSASTAPRGERKYYLSNLPADAPLEALAALIKARWVCEQLHQQLKDELGLDHFEGRSWRGLHHHALLCLLAFAFLQHLRLGGKRAAAAPEPGPPPRPSLPAVRRRIVAALTRVLLRCPHCRQRFEHHLRL